LTLGSIQYRYYILQKIQKIGQLPLICNKNALINLVQVHLQIKKKPDAGKNKQKEESYIQKQK
jgi:hypothetical protein